MCTHKTTKGCSLYNFLYAKHNMCLSNKIQKGQRYGGTERVSSPSFSVTINWPLPSPGIKQRLLPCTKFNAKQIIRAV